MKTAMVLENLLQFVLAAYQTSEMATFFFSVICHFCHVSVNLNLSSRNLLVAQICALFPHTHTQTHIHAYEPAVCNDCHNRSA